MGDPYLSSDESLILSTHNIRIDGVFLDLMLTSRRLILIDNSVNPFSLRTIPLETIITVFAGMDVKGDPIITLSHMDPSGTGAPLPMDFIFTRQKGEQRAKECNEWAATLVNYAAEARDGALSAGTLPYDPVKVIQPRMSATYGIETFSPRKPVMEEYPVRSEPVTSPELSKFPVYGKIPSGTKEPVPLNDAEMVEPLNSSTFPPQEPEEPLFSQQEIILGPDETPAIPDADEPVSFPQEIITGPDEHPTIPDTEEPVSSPQEITTGPDEHPTIPVTEEPVSSPQEITTGPDEHPTIPVTEEPVSSPQEITTGPDEHPAIPDAAQAWADAVHIVTTSSPFIPAVPVSDATPSAETIGDKTKADAELIKMTPEELVAEIKKDINSHYIMHPESPEEKASVRQGAPETAPVPALISQPTLKIQKRTSSTLVIAAIVIIILVVLGVAVIGPFYLPGSGDTSPDIVVPVVSVQITPTLLPTLVPADGLWVRIEYPGTFIGEVGNPELMHHVSGSGVRLYKILWSDRIVQASAQKQENSGDTLLIEVYNNGTLIKRSSTRIPMGGVNILIDPITGQPPGIRYGDIP